MPELYRAFFTNLLDANKFSDHLHTTDAACLKSICHKNGIASIQSKSKYHFNIIIEF